MKLLSANYEHKLFFDEVFNFLLDLSIRGQINPIILVSIGGNPGEGRVGDIYPHFVQVFPLTFTFSHNNFGLRGPSPPPPDFSHKYPPLSIPVYPLK